MIEKYNIEVIPTFLLFKRIEIKRITGANWSVLKNIITEHSGFKFNPNKKVYSHNLTTQLNNVVNSGEILAEIQKIRINKDELYFEKQKEALCGSHALNNALQFPMFDKNFLISCAKLLQIKESNLYFDIDDVQNNVYSDDSGNFNIDVLEVALGKKNFSLIRFMLKDELIPVGMYILCTGTHWFAFRRFMEDGPLWKLDSLQPEPQAINDLLSLRENKISIFKINSLL